MGRVARWIERQNADGRDAIITHPDPSYSGGDWWDYRRDCGCLVGCVRGKEAHPELARFGVGETGDMDPASHAVGFRFFRLTKRFTPERVWRACKSRAAKPNVVVMPAVTEEAAVA